MPEDKQPAVPARRYFQKISKRWKKPPEDSPDTIVVITEENLAIDAFHFPRNRTLSPFDKFWQEHRHEEQDETKRKRMDEDMEKYV